MRRSVNTVLQDMGYCSKLYHWLCNRQLSVRSRSVLYYPIIEERRLLSVPSSVGDGNLNIVARAYFEREILLRKPFDFHYFVGM